MNRAVHRQRGSILILALMVAAILAMAATGILRWSLTERRMNARHAMRLEARNAAEAAAEYAFAQVRYRMDTQTSFLSTMLDPDGSTPLVPPPASLFAGTHVEGDSISVVGGVVRTITNDLDHTHFFVDPTDPNNQFDPMKGKRIFRRDVELLAKATVTVPGIGTLTSYVGETLAMREAPMFAHALFYNMDLEISPGSQMTIYGPVHTNGALWILGPYSPATLDFRGPVTAAGGIYWGYKTPTMMGDGSTESTRNSPVRFITAAGEMVDLRSSSGIWRDHKMGSSSETIATQTAFRSFAANTFRGYLQTNVHGVEVYKPVAFGDYVPDPTPTNGVDESVNSGRAMIEPPLETTASGYIAGVESQKLSRRAGLYIVVNPSGSARTGHKPDGSAVTVPARQYRAYKADGTQVILPGSTASTAGTNHDAPGGRPIVAINPSAMIDNRRFTNFNPNNNRSYYNRFDPKTIDLVEIDMTALKMAVDWTVNGSSVSSIYDYDSSSSNSTYRSTVATSKSLNGKYSITNFNASDWNGCVYIESAEAETRRDSGVRLINGRGRVASTATGSATEGLTVATNDAVYILGHLNADGIQDTSSTTLTNSSRYPESVNEVPVAVAGDAITILSEPRFDSSGNQIAGWNDAYSAHTVTTSNYSTSWATTNPAYGNRSDGINTNIRPASSPTSNVAGSSGSYRTTKLPGSNTEISAALLTGIVPSNKNGSNQQSGGAHNFPRLLESWDSTTLSIRGSMVALFESRVANESFSVRYYAPPARHWGFNELFAQGRYPPQTPRVRTYRRVDFTDLTPSEYEAELAKMPWE